MPPSSGSCIKKEVVCSTEKFIAIYQAIRCHNPENHLIIAIKRVDVPAGVSSTLKSRHNNLLDHTEERSVISCVDVRLIMCVPLWNMNPHMFQMLHPDSQYLISAEGFFFSPGYKCTTNRFFIRL